MTAPQRMRILHCGKFYPPHRGGMETFLGHLAQAQAAMDDEVLVLAHGGPPLGRLETIGPKLALRRAAVAFTLGGYAPVAPALPLHFLNALRRFRPQVIHVHAPNGAAIWPALLRPFSAAPIVLHWHADVQFPPNRTPHPLLLRCWRRLESLALRRADAVIATSQAYLETSPELAPHRDKCRIVPLGLAEPSPSGSHPAQSSQQNAHTIDSGLDATRESSARLTEADHPALRFLDSRRDLRLLAVGRLAHYKGFGLLLQALASTPGASLCLVGEGEERTALEAVARQPALRGRVHLAGALPNDVLDACYRRSHVLCLPSLSRSEAFGVVLLEAMCRGLACLATDVPGSGMAEVLDQGRAGLLVPPGSVEMLAQALARLVAEPDLARRLGQAGRERYAERYAMPRVAAKIRAVYEEILAARP